MASLNCKVVWRITRNVIEPVAYFRGRLLKCYIKLSGLGVDRNDIFLYYSSRPMCTIPYKSEIFRSAVDVYPYVIINRPN